MPRTLHAGISTLRNRNRITNKTRLKIHHGNIEADSHLILDEDDEKHRLTNLVAGVDAEDANEHHLQEVLTASHRTHVAVGNQSAQGDKPAPAIVPQAYIPTPDSNGIADNYEELYPVNRWRDPSTFVCTSFTVEETTKDGLIDGFTYYMDERDKEWLDKNNEEARGEGTSAQGAVSTPNVRASARGAKAKEKEPEYSQPVVISEDEFELVMGIFEKVTHEKTEFLHHSLETGMSFPSFSDYQETFSVSLPANFFSSYAVPSWVPTPFNLLKIARAVYPYWKERRLQRNGHRIIPSLNFDEADTLNESYVCFRRREIKAVRKTRAQQSSSSEKLVRLQAELMYPLELAKSILTREALKKEAIQHAQDIWEKRLALVDFKRKFPGLGDKQDEELLVDKERIVKKQDTTRARIPLKIRTQDASAPPARQEVSMRPHERQAMIRERIEATLAKQRDPLWEDAIDNPYQAPYVPFSSKCFKYITPIEASSRSSESVDAKESTNREPRSVRQRCGRGGRVYLDRRLPARSLSSKRPRHSAFVTSDDEGGDMDVDEEYDEDKMRLEERWRFDQDDGPVIGPQGADEHDRILVDDYSPKYLRYAMSLVGDQDQRSLMTDAGLSSTDADGKPTVFVPYQLGMVQPSVQREQAAAFVRAFSQSTLSPAAALAMQGNQATSAPVSQLIKMSPSIGGMRPPSVTAMQNGTAAHISSPIPLPVPQHSPPNPSSRPAISMPHVDVVKPEDSPVQSAFQNGIISIQSAESTKQEQDRMNGVPARPKSQNQPQMQVPNGFHLTPMSVSNHAAPALAVTAPGYQQQQYQNTQPHALSLQQIQNSQTAPATTQQQANGQVKPQDLAALQVQQANLARGLAYLPIGPNGVPAMGINMNALPINRQMQWAATATAAGMPIQLAQVGSSPNKTQTPVGARSGVNGQMSPPQQQQSLIPMPASIQSAPHPPMTPILVMASPNLRQQAV